MCGSQTVRQRPQLWEKVHPDPMRWRLLADPTDGIGDSSFASRTRRLLRIPLRPSQSTLRDAATELRERLSDWTRPGTNFVELCVTTCNRLWKGRCSVTVHVFIMSCIYACCVMYVGSRAVGNNYCSLVLSELNVAVTAAGPIRLHRVQG